MNFIYVTSELFECVNKLIVLKKIILQKNISKIVNHSQKKCEYLLE